MTRVVMITLMLVVGLFVSVAVSQVQKKLEKTVNTFFGFVKANNVESTRLGPTTLLTERRDRAKSIPASVDVAGRALAPGRQPGYTDPVAASFR